MLLVKRIARAYAQLVPYAVLAGLLGSAVGTMVYLLYPTLDPDLRNPEVLQRVSLIPLVMFFSLFATIPGSLLIGLPTLLPFHRSISAHPLLWMVPAVALGVGVGFATLFWAFSTTAYGYRFYQDLDILYCFSGAVAWGMVASLGLRGMRQRRKAETAG